MVNLEDRLKRLNLEKISPDGIDSDRPLFVDGRGLDSIDALELDVSVRKSYAFKNENDSAEIKERFANVRSLVRCVATWNRSGTFGKYEQVAALVYRFGATIENLIGFEIISDEVGPFDHATEEDVPRELVFDDALNAWIDRHQKYDV